ncbi:MAG: hypothetical protein JWN23_2960 [Rhodocyclales bacterium]|nr:hypothetical protein [Rhodocyclales bacterium]
MSADGATPPRSGSFSNISTQTRAASFLDGVGAVTSGVAANLAHPGAQAVVGVASGVSWAASGAVAEHGNSSGWGWDRLTNAAAGAAGVLSSAATLTSYYGQTARGAITSYASSGAWALGGAVSTVRGGAEWLGAQSSRESWHGGLTALSGALNVAGAGLSISASRASAENDTATATYHGTLSSAAWLAGTATGFAAAYFAPPPQRSRASASISPVRDVEHGEGGLGSIQAPMLGPPVRRPTEISPLLGQSPSVAIDIPPRRAPSHSPLVISPQSSPERSSPAHNFLPLSHGTPESPSPVRRPIASGLSAQESPRRGSPGSLAPMQPPRHSPSPVLGSGPPQRVGSPQASPHASLSPMTSPRKRPSPIHTSGISGGPGGSPAHSPVLSPPITGRPRSKSLPLPKSKGI